MPALSSKLQALRKSQNDSILLRAESLELRVGFVLAESLELIAES